MNDNRNLVLALLLSGLILAAYYVFFAPEPSSFQETPQEPAAAQSQEAGDEPAARAQARRPGPAETAPRIPIDTPALTGSLNLAGARIDDLKLDRYRESLEEGSPTVTLLRPGRDQGGYFAAFAWRSADPGLRPALPDLNAVWRAPDGARLGLDSPVTLTFESDIGLVFERTIAVDEDYLFTVTDRVVNDSGRAVSLYPFGGVYRYGLPNDLANFLILHEGPIGVFDEEGLEQWKYGKLDDESFETRSTRGWLGITDKYWLAALVPPADRAFTAEFDKVARPGSAPIYSTRFAADAYEIAPGASLEVTQRLFAGAKRSGLLDEYAEAYGVHRLDLAIDWGNFWFLTKPFFFLLKEASEFLGNFGLGILAVTVLVRLAFFPLANKAFVSMAKMRNLQPKLKELQEKHKEDRAKLQQEMMALYKKEKVNPVAGCLPLLLQMPVFYAFYKTLFVTIEMRHTPFFGWIDDMSAPDPTAWINLFGLLPFSADAMASIPLLGALFGIGAWPVIMGSTMWLQMQLNPPPSDPIQARVLAFLPIIFTVFMGQFAAGLVIYWTWTNFLSIAQQWVIMSRMGATPEIAKKIPFLKRTSDDG